jgi:uncharacterized integral membrane protein
MSDADLQPTPEKQPSKRNAREETRLAVAVVLAGLGTAFALLNLGHAKVNYVFGTGHPRMLFVIVACLLIGGVIGWIAGRRRTGRKG